MPTQISNPKKILIVGGGFAGVKVAQELSSLSLDNCDITLVCNNPNFEYHAALYRVATGRSPRQVSIPLKTIFSSKKISLVIDRITAVDLKKQTLLGDQKVIYPYDYLILAPGSQTAYYNTPGVRQNSFPLKNLSDALKLKTHLNDMLGASQLDSKNYLHAVVVGAGATGVELAAELAVFLRKKSNLDVSTAKIDLVECGPKVLSPFGDKVSSIAAKRLSSLGVNILYNTHITKENTHGLFTNTGKFNAKTVIWVAGVTSHAIFKTIKGIKISPGGKVILEPDLSLPGFSNVFVAGDNAGTQDAGTALSALSHASFIANKIAATLLGYKSKDYNPIRPSFSIPLGPRWAISKFGPFILTGRLGWIVRKLLDFWFYSTILPISKAWWVLKRDKSL